MTKEHIDTVGSTLAIDGTTINGVYPDSLPFPKPKTGTKEVTTLKDTAVRKGLKLIDYGSASFSGIRIPGDAGQIALLTASTDRKEHVFTISIPEAGEIYTYNAFVATDYPESKDETYEFSCDLEVTGEPTLTTTYAGITSIEGAAAGIAYSPGTANTALASGSNDVIFKEATGITGDTVEVTAAAASYIGISYDGGVNWTTLTSGTAAAFSTTKWPDAGKIAKALIKVEESSKATRFVNLFIARA